MFFVGGSNSGEYLIEILKLLSFTSYLLTIIAKHNLFTPIFFGLAENSSSS